MKTLKLYTTIILQAVLLFIGLVIVTSLLANESAPNTNNFSTAILVDQEAENEIENWMIELDSWEINNSKTQQTTELNAVEDEITIEAWMLNAGDTNWNSFQSTSETLNNQEVSLEE